MLVVVAALKGGTGKTCLSVALSEVGAARWGSALIADADLQASASRWHELAAGAMRAEVLAAPTVDLARGLAAAGADRYPLVVVDCPPAHVEIVRVGLALADRTSSASPRLQLWGERDTPKVGLFPWLTAIALCLPPSSSPC